MTEQNEQSFSFDDAISITNKINELVRHLNEEYGVQISLRIRIEAADTREEQMTLPLFTEEEQHDL